MASHTEYTFVHHPRTARENCYRALALLFEHALEIGYTIRTINLVYETGGVNFSYAYIFDPFTLETTVNGAHAANSTTINVVSTAGFAVPLDPPDWEPAIVINGQVLEYQSKTATSFTTNRQHPAYSGGELVQSTPQTYVNGAHAADSATINVGSTDGFAASGSIKLASTVDGLYDHETTYTGKTATSFTGCGTHIALVGNEDVHGPPSLHIEQAAHLGLVNANLVVP